MEHDFVVPNWKVGDENDRGPRRGDDHIKVPKRPGTDTYFCTPHAGKMRGAIVVE